ncbi:protein downstream neighbor of Son-like isoform X2 [Impatiens glandulifera]|uniref:protein downstream neighbor of Son-like isoform X2 n=1 Tax=Impatiens glandulifera TaxID=253017 RepID=UPI001FB0AEC5|nr:protein downstream neighbor of Son-like isoform X2 [Impatiens glandulifera]
MVEVAAQRSLTSNTVHFGDEASNFIAVKRKTPSELRGEQLRRKKIVELVDESPPISLPSLKANCGSIPGLDKPDFQRNPRYVNTRVDEVFPVRKSSIQLSVLSAKQTDKKNNGVEINRNLKSCNSAVLAGNGQPHLSQGDTLAFTATMGVTVRACNTEKCGESTFRTVSDLSFNGEKLPGMASVDLEKAFKGLGAPEPLAPISNSTSENSSSEFHVHGKKTPLDFTLKTTMRVLSSSPVNWFHRLVNSGPCYSLPELDSEFGCSGSEKANPRALHSWVYPDSSLPPSIILMLKTSTFQGVQMDFLSKRQLSWEASFRSLYYMLRKSICNIFYVCTGQFVLMFTGDGSVKGLRTCHAYMSRSTRGLRSLLKEHDICFSMPLCRSKVDEATTEDLVELSEMEKHNLGQIRWFKSTSDVDNSEQSVLAFTGNKNVHGLFDFLLNYRHLLKSLSSDDLPVLYSPVPFQNATFSAPEVRCKEVKSADSVAHPLKESIMNEGTCQASPTGFVYSIEIKNTYLPPWVISSVCEIMSAKTTSFEASFVTIPASSGLNIVLDSILKKSDTVSSHEEESRHVFNVPNAFLSPKLCHASLKCLKYRDGSYNATVSPL